jgi:general nucleoside transport system permease protein
MNKKRILKVLDSVLVPLLAIIAGLGVAVILISLTKNNVGESFNTLAEYAFSCESLIKCKLFATLERATPLILTGLSAVVAFRSGMFSIGQEGQMMLGSIVAAWLGYAILLPAGIHPLVVIIASMGAGAFYGWIPGVLYVKLGVNLIISTIVMNTIAILLLEYVVNFPLRADAGATAHSFVIQETAFLPTFFAGSKWGWGFVIAVIAAIIVYYYLWYSKAGYQQRMSGEAPWFAKFGGIKNEKIAIRSMLISGALAGLAGSIEVLTVHHRIITGFSTNLGFDGLMVAILGQSHPIGVLIVAFLFAGIRMGAQLGLQFRMGIPRELGGSIIGFIVLFVAMEKFFQGYIDKVKDWYKKYQKKDENTGEVGEGA